MEPEYRVILWVMVRWVRMSTPSLGRKPASTMPLLNLGAIHPLFHPRENESLHATLPTLASAIHPSRSRLLREKSQHPQATAARRLIEEKLSSFKLGERDHDAKWPVGEFRTYRRKLAGAIEHLSR